MISLLLLYGFGKGDPVPPLTKFMVPTPTPALTPIVTFPPTTQPIPVPTMSLRQSASPLVSPTTIDAPTQRPTVASNTNRQWTQVGEPIGLQNDEYFSFGSVASVQKGIYDRHWVWCSSGRVFWQSIGLSAQHRQRTRRQQE